MEKQAKKSFGRGALLLLVLAVATVLYINNTHGKVVAKEAQIVASTYSTGTDYTGVVTKQFVNKGDTVVAGQTLFYIKSGVLSEQIKDENVNISELLYPLTDEGEIILKATKPGVVSSVDYTVGSFVPANKEVATIFDTSALTVQAKYELLKADYARITPNTYMSIELPSGQKIDARVSSVEVVEQKQKITANVEASIAGVSIKQLKNNTNTPVSATLKLSDKSWASRLYGYLGFSK